MFKRISLLLMISLLILTLAACAASESQVTESPSTVEVSTASSPTVASPTETPATETPTATDQVVSTGSYPIVDTNQGLCYNNSELIDCPAEGEPFYGQDAQYTGNEPSYTDNGDGTITDNVTGLTWQKSPDTNGDGDIRADDKLSYSEAISYCQDLALAGYDDWQLPTIKQLYSLILFSGQDPSGYSGSVTLVPFIDSDVFDFAYGDTSAGERIIDSQYASSTLYVSDANDPLLFGVNFADGRIKGYGLTLFGHEKTFFVTCVRGNTDYGVNDFVDNGDGIITDNATGLMWAQDDSGKDMNWEEALAWVQQMNEENYLGYSDWRLPNAKELQSIVDYSRSPDMTGSAAIAPLFNATPITNEAGQTDYPFYWSSTTHANLSEQPGANAAYVSFGRAMGYMDDVWQDVHGAGAQRSDPKTGDPAAFPTGHGPQGDAIRIYNYVRLVRDGNVTLTPAGNPAMAERSGITVEVSADLTIDMSQDRPGQPPQIDLAAAAEKLGVSEEALQAALGNPAQGPPDFTAAAATLGITEAELLDAFGVPVGGQPPAGQPPAGGQPPTGQP